jgi:hypothetical protein
MLGDGGRKAHVVAFHFRGSLIRDPVDRGVTPVNRSLAFLTKKGLSSLLQGELQSCTDLGSCASWSGRTSFLLQ